MNRGSKVNRKLPALAREKGFSQSKLEAATGIGHSTMSRYWSGRGGLGLKNGRLIAEVLNVDLNDLGLSEEGDPADEVLHLRRALAALEATVEVLTTRVAELERAEANPPRARQARKPKAARR